MERFLKYVLYMEGLFLKIRKDLENENNLIRVRKPPFLIRQMVSLDEQANKYPCLFDKNNKMKNIQRTRHLKKRMGSRRILHSFYHKYPVKKNSQSF